MNITRRKLFGFAAAAAVSLIVPELVISTKSIFLPPKGGWLQLPYAQLVIPRDHAAEFYAAEIAAGTATYDINTEMMSWWRAPAGQALRLDRGNDLPFVALDEFGKPVIQVYRGKLPKFEYARNHVSI
jgi:hypothetical protein